MVCSRNSLYKTQIPTGLVHSSTHFPNCALTVTSPVKVLFSALMHFILLSYKQINQSHGRLQGSVYLKITRKMILFVGEKDYRLAPSASHIFT